MVTKNGLKNIAMQKFKKIAVIGPESTGKSTLCEMLAAHYHTLWCPEYAREYLLKHGKDYSFEDLIKIAKGQMELEVNFELEIRNSKSEILFLDTEMYVMKVWYEYVFNKCHHFILEEIAKRKYDLYLLCNTDLTWVSDELREYPDEKNRLELFHIYKDILVNQTTPWIEIKGNDEQRFKQAVLGIDSFLK